MLYRDVKWVLNHMRHECPIWKPVQQQHEPAARGGIATYCKKNSSARGRINLSLNQLVMVLMMLPSELSACMSSAICSPAYHLVECDFLSHIQPDKP